MKARIVKLENSSFTLKMENSEYMLLTSNGSIIPVSFDEAKEFCFNWKNSKYYIGGIWAYDDITMEDYEGKTVAYVNDDMELIFPNPELFRELFTPKDIKYIPIKEYADNQNKSFNIIQRYCREGRFPTAKKFDSSGWYVPEDAPYPTNSKTRS